ncbi:MAG: hypothetical protein ACHRXM_06350 [Isosphaerales bacterium]
MADQVEEDVFAVPTGNDLEGRDRLHPIGRRPDKVPIHPKHLPEPEEALRELSAILREVWMAADKHVAPSHRPLAPRPCQGRPPEPEQNGGGVGPAVSQAVPIRGTPRQ